jgi:hypothetical protein
MEMLDGVEWWDMIAEAVVPAVIASCSGEDRKRENAGTYR